jgi:DNA repair exonuclease SbcCD ATPase subunit
MGMKRDRKESIFSRLVSQKSRTESGGSADGLSAKMSLQQRLEALPPSLSGEALEDAYRKLLVENVMLREHNQELGQTLEREHVVEHGAEAAEQLIRAQRNALAERSHRMREIEYAYKRILRERKKQDETNQQLQGQLERLVTEAQSLRRQHAAMIAELKETRSKLDDKNDELIKMTARYDQLEAAIEKFSVPHGTVVNG